MKTNIKSIVGTVPKETGQLRSAFSSFKSASGPSIVEIDGKTYFIGDYAKKYSRNPVSNLSGEHFTSPEMLLPLTYAALTNLPYDEPISLVVSLPIAVMLSDKASSETTNSLRSLLIGKHDFKADGVEKHIEIENIAITAQGAAALYSDAIDINGDTQMDTELLKEKLGVIDIGFGTLDLFTLSDLDIDAEGTTGCDLGAHFPVEELQTQIRVKYGVNLSQEQAIDSLSGRRQYVYCDGQQIAIKQVLDNVFDIWISEIEKMLQRHIQSGHDYAKLYFCGGGVSFISDRLKARFPHGVVLSDPIFANAIGCYRYGKALKVKNPVGIDPGFFAYKVVVEE